MVYRKDIIKRVDVQVAILVTSLVILSSVVVFYYAYTQSYTQMIESLEHRVNAIAVYVDKHMPSPVFTEISSEEDMLLPAYSDAQSFLSETREISSAQYLYTATKNKEGQLIYHIDGLPEEDEDFRKPGALIEPDFQDELRIALTGKVVMPGVIKNTEWGDVFVAYYPIHNDKNTHIIGALGIEFPASHQYNAFRQIRYITPIIIFITCVIAFFTSRILFRRISNPHFKDLANTDSLTNLKNRNAFDLDIENLISSGRVHNYALVLADLNSLKAANDQFGHKMGDEYIKHFANTLISHEKDNHIPYRIGGDEFAIFFYNTTHAYVENYITEIKSELKKSAEATIPFCSVAVGFSVAEKLTYDSWEKTQIEADKALYLDKKSFYEQNHKCDNRRERSE